MFLPGDWVEILSAPEILRTLGPDQALDGLPFMPEMVDHCGERHRVAMRGERVCVNPPEIPFRRLGDTVVLAGLRCDGRLHAGCELGCMFLWKEAWLRRSDATAPRAVSTPASGAPPHPAGGGAGDPVRLRSTVAGDPDRYLCQATELRVASEPGVPIWQPGQYLHFVRVGTFTVRQVVALFARPLGRRLRWAVTSRLPSRRRPAACPPEHLGLAPGEWVEVRSRDEILRTLDSNGRHKGLSFSTDLYRHGGHPFRVERQVTRIIAEQNGHVLPLRDTVILEGSVCDRYRGCARGMPILWREAWLKRSGGPPTTSG